jgi:hypothetical protein
MNPMDVYSSLSRHVKSDDEEKQAPSYARLIKKAHSVHFHSIAAYPPKVQTDISMCQQFLPRDAEGTNAMVLKVKV